MDGDKNDCVQIRGSPRIYPVNTKHLCNICTMLDQRRRRWAEVVQMLHKCFVFAGDVPRRTFLYCNPCGANFFYRVGDIFSLA